MEIQELLTLNSEGLIPGPGETEEAFRERIQAVKEHFQMQEQTIAPHHWQWAAEQLKALFDFTPRWCTAIYSSKGLAPWQAAATWIDVKRVYTIQLKPSRYLSWLVDRNEVLAHEATHAARAAFDEPKSEEMFAYLTSSAKWRQVIGPLFRRPQEALLLFGLMGAGAISQIAEAIWDFTLLSDGCFFLAAVISLGWSFRLLRMRIQIKRAADRLTPMLRNPKDLRAVLFRLTDDEIARLAKGRVVGNQELRWKMLREAYFIPKPCGAPQE